MTDITKCKGVNCEDKDTCWRFLAPADPFRQSYSSFDEVRDKVEPCPWLLPVKKLKDKYNRDVLTDQVALLQKKVIAYEALAIDQVARIHQLEQMLHVIK